LEWPTIRGWKGVPFVVCPDSWKGVPFVMIPGSIKTYKVEDVTKDFKGYSVEMRENFSYITEKDISLTDLVIYRKDRDWLNYFLFFWYRAVKVFYVTIWCYLAPFLTLVLSYAIPLRWN
jgi:hypothetical protein